MHMHLIAVGTRMPAWVKAGYAEYSARLPRECSLRLVEISAGKRGKHADLNRIRQTEGERLLEAVPAGAKVVLLDERGRQWTTEDLAAELNVWLHGGRDIAILIGGPEGLAPVCHARAEQVWSLSKLTLPHPLVRVVVAEQLYRAWSIVSNHPYHRA